jgi:hypothetical protein
MQLRLPLLRPGRALSFRVYSWQTLPCRAVPLSFSVRRPLPWPKAGVQGSHPRSLNALCGSRPAFCSFCQSLKTLLFSQRRLVSVTPGTNCKGYLGRPAATFSPLPPHSRDLLQRHLSQAGLGNRLRLPVSEPMAIRRTSSCPGVWVRTGNSSSYDVSIHHSGLTGRGGIFLLTISIPIA